MHPLDAVLKQALAEYDQHQAAPYVVRPSLPVLYFGDSQRYLRSPLRVVTVGLNPSLDEFPSRNPFGRFPAAKAIHGNAMVMNPSERATVLGTALDRYFATAPYGLWFDPSFGAILEGFDASYYGRRPNTAVHTDLCSPLATSPTWSKLPDAARATLRISGRALWDQLMRVLMPDVVLVSVQRSLLESIRFQPLTPWQDAVSYSQTKDGQTRSKPYVVETRWMSIDGSKRTLFVFGEASQKPFANLSHAQQSQAARSIWKKEFAAIVAR